MREAISARLDGEPAGVERSVLEAHLASCVACASWREQAHELTRRVRLASARAAPAPGQPLLDGLTAVAGRGRWRSIELTRAALTGVAAVQTLIAVPALLLGHDREAPIGVAHAMGSFDMALAVGLFVAAWRPARARGMHVLVGTAALLLVVTAAVDVVGGHTSLGDEAPHLIAVGGWLLLRQLAALVPAGDDDYQLPLAARGRSRAWRAPFATAGRRGSGREAADGLGTVAAVEATNGS